MNNYRPMIKKRKTEITIEAHEVWLVRSWRRGAPTRCAECPDRPEMLTPEEAARLAGLTSRAIYRLVESDQIHSTETEHGALFVCLAPLRSLETQHE